MKLSGMGIAAIILMLAPAAAMAQSAAGEPMWDQVRSGGKVCFADHEHYGESPSWPTERGAKAAAIRKWETFTAWEYGKAWGSYRLAVHKSLNCSQSGGRWVCATNATPCRRR